MKSVAYLLIASVVLLVIIIGFTFTTTVIEIQALGNRVEDSLIAAGWAGFSCLDLDKLAERVYLDNEELRDIYTDKDQAAETVISYIRENLSLDTSLYPKDESYIQVKSKPVILDELTVFNPDDLPALCSRGTSLQRTTIHIAVSIPVEVKWLGLRYIEKHVDVDVKSFFKSGGD